MDSIKRDWRVHLSLSLSLLRLSRLCSLSLSLLFSSLQVPASRYERSHLNSDLSGAAQLLFIPLYESAHMYSLYTRPRRFDSSVHAPPVRHRQALITVLSLYGTPREPLHEAGDKYACGVSMLRHPTVHALLR